MMKYLLIIIAVFLPPVISSSSNGNFVYGISQSKYKVYCEITYLPITRNVLVNVGSAVDVIRDSKGEPVEFITVMAAVNYMAKLGWEIADVYGIPKGDDKATFIYMVKEVTDDSQVTDGLNLKMVNVSLPKGYYE